MTIKPKRGRPSSYTKDLADKICDQLAQGMTLREVCRGQGIPDHCTVLQWVREDREGFSNQYAKAREAGYQVMADELVEIADDGSNDYMLRKRGDDEIEVMNPEVVARSRLRVDTRKWLLSKALPKIYGEKLALTDPDGGPLKVEIVKYSDDQAPEQLDPAGLPTAGVAGMGTGDKA